MKKLLLFTTALLITGNVIFAQTFKAIIGGDAGDLGSCELILKNGNIVFYSQNHKTKKYKLLIYDNKLTKIVEKEFKYKTPELNRAYGEKDQNIFMQKIYEINGKLVMFEMDNKVAGKNQCGLFRIIINSTTLDIEKEELILTTDRAGISVNSPTFSIFDEDSPFYFINKDENSDYYAIIKYTYQKRNDASNNYEVHHYSPDHKEISNAKFDYVDNKYDYARPLNLLVYADKYVIIATYAFNSEKKNNMDTKIVFSKLEKGKTNFTHQELEYSQNFDSDFCSLKKNENNNCIEALIYTKLDYKSDKMYYSLIFQTITPDRMETSKPFVLPQNMLNDYVIKNCNEKKGYGSGMINGYKINEKGNNLAYVVKNVFMLKQGEGLSGNPEMIGFCEFDTKGKEINAWAYPHLGDGTLIPVCNSKGNFAIINEIEENMDKPLNVKFKDTYEKELNAVLLTLKDNGEISREYVFGKQEKKKNIYIHTEYYDERSKTIIAWIRVGKDAKNDKDNKEQIALIKFE